MMKSDGDAEGGYYVSWVDHNTEEYARVIRLMITAGATHLTGVQCP
jgi:hypothetical protein